MARSKLYRYRSHFKVLFWLALAGITVLALMPQASVPQTQLSDKGNHVFAFVVLGFLLRMGFRISYFKGLALLILYGTAIEAVQYFTPDRYTEWEDVAADTIGTFVGFKLYKYLAKVLR